MVLPTLLESACRLQRTVRHIVSLHAQSMAPDEGLILVAHGSRDELLSASYAHVLACGRGLDDRVMLACLLGEPAPESVVAECKKRSMRKVTLFPLMLAAGRSVDELAETGHVGTLGYRLKQAGIAFSVVAKGMLDDTTIVSIWGDEIRTLLSRFVA